jgi:hypothetical protein
MSHFMEMLSSRKSDDLQGDVFDLLDTLGDFTSFKEMMVSAKQVKDGKQLDLSGLLHVTRA